MAHQHVLTAADVKGNNSPNVTVACMWETGTKQMHETREKSLSLNICKMSGYVYFIQMQRKMELIIQKNCY